MWLFPSCFLIVLQSHRLWDLRRDWEMDMLQEASEDAKLVHMPLFITHKVQYHFQTPVGF